MENLTARLRDLGAQLRAVAGAALAEGAMHGAGEAEVVALMDAAGAALRPIEAVLVATAGEIGHRSSSPRPAERMCTRFGARNPRELVERVTRISNRRAGDLVSAGEAVQQPTAVTSGEVLPADFPAMREVLAEGAVGVDAVIAVAGVIGRALPKWHERAAADEELAASARGAGVDGAPPASADELRMQAQVWAMVLDQDGAEPREVRANRKRGFSLGVCRDGLVPVRGALLAEVAGQLELLFAAIDNPRLQGPNFVDEAEGSPTESEAETDERIAASRDTRTPSQRRHDALATALTAAARSGQLPTIGGAAPTLVVSVADEDLAANTGFAHIDGIDEPLPISVARHVACGGVVQRVRQGENGRICAIDVLDRCFNAPQRKAISLRDGECVIPGCHVPAKWCEIHHVEEASRGGPTSTDNGVALCWHHHRTLDTGGWQVRMRDGVPEVRAPRWLAPFDRWRPVTNSPITRRRRLTTRRGSAPRRAPASRARVARPGEAPAPAS